MIMQTTILANGLFPQDKQIIDILRKSERLICCDGAIAKLLNVCIEPDIIIGDLDSISSKLKDKYSDILIQIPDENTNDLTKAVNYCIEMGVSSITIVGATGNREDHTLGNIALLADYMNRIDVKMISDFGTFIPFKKSTIFESFIGQQVSIFSLTPQVNITTSGLKYPLKRQPLHRWWNGTLNESLSESFQIELCEEGEFIVYLLRNES